MKTKRYLFIMVGLLIILGGIANAQDKKPVTTEAWRKSLDAFVQEVIDISEKSEIPDAAVAITRIRSYREITNQENEKLGVIFPDGFGKEFHGELTKKFKGQVSWRGIVDSVETDAKNKTQIIKIKFPAQERQPTKFTFADWIALDIPISKLDSGKLPSKGDKFAFRGNLRKAKEDAPFESVYVFYGLGRNAGVVRVGVRLNDVEPLGKK